MKRLLLLVGVFAIACSSPIESPTVLKNYSSPAEPDEVVDFVEKAASQSSNQHFEISGKSIEGKDIVVFKSLVNGQNEPLKVLVFAQQHGNEQSGKEASMLLIRDIANGELSDLSQNMEIWVVPQLNPDGGRTNQRRNANGTDLNRDHVLLNAPETKIIHTLFSEFMPHVTIDIHEYQPYSESWKEFGGYKNFDVQVGTSTNINIPHNIREFGLERALPAIEKHLSQLGFTFHNYIVGPAPHLGRTRHSTVDFNDGRQSFGILNTLSFIFEGKNGKDSYADNLERRATSQYEGLKALLQFLSSSKNEALTLVNSQREKLINAKVGENISIRMEHFAGDKPLKLDLISSTTNQDTTVIVSDYHSLVKSTLDVKRPEAYLIPKSDTMLVHFMDKHKISYSSYSADKNNLVTMYRIGDITISNDEELDNRYPEINIERINGNKLSEPYHVVPTNQLHSNFLVMSFEPQSMLGLPQRSGFEYLLKDNSTFPIYRLDGNI
ncbi:MAG: M14 family zinc carboxypeptidase [Perlabentimonas sp.]